MMTRLILMFAFCISLISNVAAENVATSSKELKSGVFDPPRMAPDFSLASSRDTQFTLSEQRGNIVVLGFGFSHCPNVCPMTLANLAQTYKNLGALADQVQVVYMTVDPERDTPARLREYLANFNPNFIGVTGAAEDLAALRQSYGIIAKKEVHKNGGTYEVHHSSYIYLIDRDGLLRALVPFGKSADDITHDINILLHEKTQQAAL